MRQVSFWPRLWGRFCLSPGVAGYGSPQQLLHVRSLQRAGQREATSVLPQVARRAQAARQVAASEVVYADYVSSAFCYRTDCPDSPARPAPWPLQRSVDPPTAHARAATPRAQVWELPGEAGARARARSEEQEGGEQLAGLQQEATRLRLQLAARPPPVSAPHNQTMRLLPSWAVARAGLNRGPCHGGWTAPQAVAASGRGAPRRQRRGPGRTPSAPRRRPKSGCTRRRASS